MQRLLGKSSLRFYGRHPWQLVLALAGIGLGVAVFVGITLANDSARRAFTLSTEALRGTTTHRLLPLGAGLDEAFYVEFARSGHTVRMAPVIEAQVVLRTDAGARRIATLLGIDPLKEAGLRAFSSSLSGDASTVVRLLTTPQGILLPRPLADELGVAAGDTVTLDVGGASRTARVVGTTPGADPGGNPPLVADLGSAEELLGSRGRLSRIDLVLDADALARLEQAIPPGTVLVPASDDGALGQMTRAFTTNLTALGLLALVVGMFLIYATMSFAVVQRRRSLAVLRTVGLSRGQLLASVLAEAAAIGLVGALAGLALGHWLATGLLELVLRTMQDLYFRRALGTVTASPWIYVHGLTLGVGATLVSALVPALEAARTDPATAERRSSLERAAERSSRRAAWLSLPCIALAAVLIAVDRSSLLVAFAGLFLTLAAGAVVIPAATAMLMRLVGRLGARWLAVPGRMAVRGVTASLSRTGVATAALAVAVATVISIGLMISSFRTSFIAWLDETLTADLYVAFDESEGADAALPTAIAAIEALPDVTGVSLSRVARLPTSAGELGLRAATPGPAGWGVDVVDSATGDPTSLLAGHDTVLVTEPHAFRYRLRVGDTVDLPTANGPRPFEIAGIYRDYNTSAAVYLMALDTYRRHWNDSSVTGLGIHLREDADRASAAREIRTRLPGLVDARIRSTAAIERLSLTVFDRTFQITEVLRMLAGLVAFLGVLSAVLALQLEREREFAVLRSIGMSARELARQVLWQTGLLGLAAGLAALPIGVALAWLLVHVINQRSFGWSMSFVLAPAPLLQGLALAVGAALLAGIYPALVGGRVDLNVALRDE